MGRSSAFAAVIRRAALTGLGCVLLVCAAAASPAMGEELVLRSSFGPDGTTESDFQRAAEIAVDQGTGDVYVIDQEKDSLYKFGSKGEPESFTGTAPYISGNQISGLAFAWKFKNDTGDIYGTVQVAVNSHTHVFYVTGGGGSALRAFQADGEPADFSAGPGEGTNEITGFGRISGVAVDSNGDVYASEIGPEDDSGGTIHVYAPSGALITQIQVSRPTNVAVAPDGSLYVIRSFNDGAKYGPTELVKLRPSVFPVVGGTEYSIASELSVPGFPRSLSVDPSSEDLYVVGTEAKEFLEEGTFESPPKRVVEYDPVGNLLGSFAGPEEEGELPQSVFAAPLGVAVDGASGTVYVSFFGRGSQVEVLVPPPPAAPVIGSVGSKGVTSGSADLVAAIAANLLETTYRFEYGTEDCSLVPDPCTVVAPGSGDAGSGRKSVSVSRHLGGLAPGTTYHFRVVAENELGFVSAERVFTTQSVGGAFDLLDGRGWELVSPALKVGGGAIVPPGSGIGAASASGDAFTFQSLGPIVTGVQGNRAPELSQLLARRGASDWVSTEIAPVHEHATPVVSGESEFRFFSSDLTRAAVEPQGASLLSVEASERTPYLREEFAESVRWRPLVTGKEGYANVPPGTVFGGEPLVSSSTPLRVKGASGDLRNVVVSSSVPLVTGIASEQVGKELLYEWGEGTLKLVSVLPSGQPSEARLGSEAAALGAVSGGGRFVYWNTGSSGALYVRDLANEETVRLDLVKTGASGEGEAAPVFQGASVDGTRAFFTDTQQLTSDAGPGTNLYECDLVRPNKDKCLLSDVTAGAGEEGVGVQGMVSAIDETGDTVYFVANGVLSEAPNSAGETARPGGCLQQPSQAKPGSSCNLYVSRLEGESWQTRFVARLDSQDAPDWGIALHQAGEKREVSSTGPVAAGSPNGRYLVFMSDRSLTGYDNADGAGGGADVEVYVYDSASDVLHCASCNPTGGEPYGAPLDNGFEVRVVDWRHVWNGRRVAATLPDPDVVDAGVPASYRPRVVLDDGRVFFNAADSLVSGDSNGTWDAYEYEPVGVGDCGGALGGSVVTSSEDGCVGLLSSGVALGETGVVDSSASGEDVFFLTTGGLSPRDTDNDYDVYDARVGAAPERVASVSECLGEACLSAPVVPSVLTPASYSFEGAGNAVAPGVPRSAVKPRTLSRSERLARALKACRKKYAHSGKKRVVCERRSRKRYAVKSQHGSIARKGAR